MVVMIRIIAVIVKMTELAMVMAMAIVIVRTLTLKQSAHQDAKARHCQVTRVHLPVEYAGFQPSAPVRVLRFLGLNGTCQEFRVKG